MDEASISTSTMNSDETIWFFFSFRTEVITLKES